MCVGIQEWTNISVTDAIFFSISEEIIWVHKGSVLGPTLFVVFINDMPDVITSISKMFADDAKVFRQMETSAATATLQNDLDHLTDWSIKWQMNFNVYNANVSTLDKQTPTINTPLQVLI